MKLKKGDVIYYCYGNTPTSVFTIDRTTRTMAFSSNTRFKIEYGENGYIHAIGRMSSFSARSCYIQSDELKAEYHKSAVLFDVKNIDFDNLDVMVLESILKLVEGDE